MLLHIVRYGIPVVLILTGQVLVFVADEGAALEAWAMFTGAGLAVLLLNVLFRIGVEGDNDRDREDAARRYFDEHGHWPDQRRGG